MHTCRTRADDGERRAGQKHAACARLASLGPLRPARLRAHRCPPLLAARLAVEHAQKRLHQGAHLGGGGAGGRGGAGQGGGEAEVEQRGQTVGSKYVQSREMASGQGREPGLARFGSPLDRSQVAGLSKAGGCQEVQPRGKAGCCHRAMPDGQGRQAQQQAGVAAGQRAAGQRAAGRQAAAEQGPSRWATCTRPLPRATARSSCLPRPHNRPAPGADWWPRSAPPQTRRRRRWLRHEGG